MLEPLWQKEVNWGLPENLAVWEAIHLAILKNVQRIIIESGPT